MFIVPIQPAQLTGMADLQNKKSIGGGSELPFENILNQAMQNMEETQRVSRTDAETLALGEVDDLAQVQINSMKAKSALQTAVQLTSRVVSAYKEVMQMSV